MAATLHEAEKSANQAQLAPAKHGFKRYFSKLAMEYMRSGDRHGREGDRSEAVHDYAHAAMLGVNYAKLHSRLKALADDVLAIPRTERTRSDSNFLNNVFYVDSFEDEEHARERKERAKTGVMHHEKPVMAAIGVVAAIAVGIGTMMSTLKVTVGYATEGSNSAILAAFILLALLYFYMARPHDGKK